MRKTRRAEKGLLPLFPLSPSRPVSFPSDGGGEERRDSRRAASIAATAVAPPSLRPSPGILPSSLPSHATDRPTGALPLTPCTLLLLRERERREARVLQRSPHPALDGRRKWRRKKGRPSFLPSAKEVFPPTPSDSSFRRPPPSTAGRVRRGPFSLALLLPPLARPSAPLPAPSAQLISPRSPRLSLQHEEGSKEPCLPLSPLRLGNQHWRDRGKEGGRCGSLSFSRAAEYGEGPNYRRDSFVALSMHHCSTRFYYYVALCPGH